MALVNLSAVAPGTLVTPGNQFIPRGVLWIYQPATTTPINIYADSAGTIPVAQPLTTDIFGQPTDANGDSPLWADGPQKADFVYTANGTTHPPVTADLVPGDGVAPLANPTFTGLLSVGGIASATAVLIAGDPQGQTGPLLLMGTLPGIGAPTTGTWPPPTIAALIAVNPVLAAVPAAGIDSAGNWQVMNSGGTPGVWNGAGVSPPVVSNVFADTLTPTTATLHGTINPSGVATNYQFLIGTDTTYGLTPIPLLPTFMGSDSNNDTVSAVVTGLSPSTAYHFELLAGFGAGGTVPSGDFTFTTTPTVPPPTVTAGTPSLLTSSSAKLNGTVVSNNAVTTWVLQWGPTSSYGTSTTGTTPADLISHAVSASMTSLSANTLYHWELHATNANGGPISTGDQTFTTLNATAPTAVTQAASSIGNNGATLNGSSNPEGNATTFHFDLGLATGNYSLGHFPAVDAVVGSGSSPVSVNQALTGLAPNVQYFYRLVTKSTAGGVTFGSELNFTTTNVTTAAQFFRYSYANPLTAPAGRQNFSRFKTVWLGSQVNASTNASYIAGIKAENPNCRVLVYVDAVYYKTTDPNGYTCGVVPSVVNAHEEWFLHDQTGARVQSATYPGNYYLDYGNASYQQAVIAHITGLAHAAGFDGVFMDDWSANLIGWGFPAGKTCPAYPTTASWQAAVTSFASVVGPAVKAAGLFMTANFSGAYAFPTANLWQAWGPYVDGMMEQAFTDAGSGIPGQAYAFATQLANNIWAEANGKQVQLITKNNTEAGQTFALAAGLLASNGNLLHGTQRGDVQTNDTWYGAGSPGGEYDNAILLGAPSGAATGSASTGYQRLFAGGSASNVKVNPTSSAKTIGGVSVPAYTGQVNFVP